MRIIAGKFKGQKLINSKNYSFRQTTDTNSEAICNIITHSTKINFNIEGCTMLDLFSGSGAMSLEVISRGAKSASLIDNNFNHLNIAKQNFKKITPNSEAKFYCFDLIKKTPDATRKHNLIFLDPPYSKNLAIPALRNICDHNWVEKGALIIIEYSKQENLEIDENQFEILDRKESKETSIIFLKNLF